MKNDNYQKIILAFVITIIFYLIKPDYVLVYIVALLAVCLYIAYNGHKAYLNHLEATERMSKNEIKEVVDENEYHAKILSGLIKTVNMPIIFIDKDGVIRYTNQAFRTAFNFPHLRGESYKDLFKDNLLSVVEQSYVFENKLDTVVNINNNYYQIESRPIFKDEIVFDGSIILFTDVSQMKEIEKMQQQFFSDVSHELKTPMSAIIGSVEILKNDGYHDEKTFNEFVDILLNESKRMQGIINDILKLANLEQPQFKIELKEVNVKEVIKKEVNLFDALAKEKQISLVYENKVDKPVTLDYATLKTALDNLISNAIKYSNEGVISVKTKIKDNNLVIKVQDEGIGIDSKHLPFIYERFYQVDKSRSEKNSSGLGLSIVKKMIENNNGSIKVESVVGVGTLFTVKLPIN